jgi:hypothetical protein
MGNVENTKIMVTDHSGIAWGHIQIAGGRAIGLDSIPQQQWKIVTVP